MNKSIIVYGKDFETACNKLDDILENIDKSNIGAISKSKNQYTILLKNGDRYVSLIPCDSARGYRWQYAYIDENIKKDILNTLVFSKLVPLDNKGVINFDVKIKDCFEYY